MPKRTIKSEEVIEKYRPALTPEGRESQLIALAENEAEYQMRNHCASAGVIVHYLRLATEKEKLEREKLRNENLLLIAKSEAIQSQKDIQELYADAIKAMKDYSGEEDDEQPM